MNEPEKVGEVLSRHGPWLLGRCSCGVGWYFRSCPVTCFRCHGQLDIVARYKSADDARKAGRR